MSSLSKCLKRMNLSQHEAAILRGQVKELVDDGIEAHAAAVQAVQEHLEALQSERADIVAQIDKQGGYVPAVVIDVEQKSRPAPSGDKGGPKLIGKNSRNLDLFEDENGVRSYVDSGISVTETVSLTPTREGMKPSVDPSARGGDYLTEAERAAKSPGKSEKGPETAPPSENRPEANRLSEQEARTLADLFATRFAEGSGFKTILEARSFAAQTIHRPVPAGSVLAKEIDEAIEVGVVQAARTIIKGHRTRGSTDKEIFDSLLELYQRQPNLNVRTSTSITNQAYSTPVPLAFIASRLAGIETDTQVYEPTAGNGMLLIEAGTKPGTNRAFANEINPERAKALDSFGFRVRRGDATTFDPRGNGVAGHGAEAVIANPPFGYVKDDSGRTREWKIDERYTTNQIDHAISLRALEAMKDDGKAVLIVGAPKEGKVDGYDAAAKRSFYFTLYRDYNVVDHFTVAGDLYAKQGAAWPVDVIVIHGRGKSALRLPQAVQPKVYGSWGALKEKLDGSGSTERGSRTAGSEAAAEGDAGGSTAPAGAGGPRTHGVGDRRPLSPEPGQPKPVGQRSGGGAGPQSGGEQHEREPGKRVGGGDLPGPAGPADTGGAERVDVGKIFDEEFAKLFGDHTKAPKRGGGIEVEDNTGPHASSRPFKVGDVLFANKGVAEQYASEQSALGRTAGEAGKSALKETGSGLADVAKGLDALFGGKGKLGSGPSFDEETYEKAKPHFITGVQHFGNAAMDVRDMVRQLMLYLRDKASATAEAIMRMKQYIERFIEDVTAGKIKLVFDKPTVQSQRKPQETETEHQKAHTPRSSAPAIGSLVPANMQESITSATAALEARVGNLDDFVATALDYKPEDIGRYFSGEQVEALALAIDALDKGSGFIIGDQCVAGETRVYDPVAETYTPISELAARGAPHAVLSLTPNGFTQRMAVSFRKGVADLYRVTLDDGRQITVTRQHRFLTPLGWASLDDGIDAGVVLSTHEASAPNSPATRGEGVLHCSQTPRDCMVDYFDGSRQCGELLRSQASSDQVFVPSQDDALERSLVSSHLDGRSTSRGYSRRRQALARPAKRSSVPMETRALATTTAQAFACDGPALLFPPGNAAQFGRLSVRGFQESAAVLAPVSRARAVDLFLNASDAGRRASQGGSTPWQPSPRTHSQGRLHASRGRNAPQSRPMSRLTGSRAAFASRDYDGWRRVVSVEFVRRDEFYDMHVPGPENYVAEGFVNHNTGIGKGRVNAGVIRWAIKNGKVPIFVTEKPNLYGDIIRDLIDIGMPNLRALMTNNNTDVPLDDEAALYYAEHGAEVEAAKAAGSKAPRMPAVADRPGKWMKSTRQERVLQDALAKGSLNGYDVVFTTYSQMQTVAGGKFLPRHDFLTEFSKDAVVLFDESHNAGGTEKQDDTPGGRPNPNDDKPKRSDFARAMLQLASSVFYSSATYAKRASVMDLYFRTDMSKAVGSISQLVRAIQEGGVPLQQVVASMLAKAGQYIRREKSFAGIEYDTRVVKVNRGAAEKISAVMKSITEFDHAKAAAVAALDGAIKGNAGSLSEDGSIGAAGATSTNFTSLMHNIVNQMLLALKTAEIVDDVLESLKRGEKPVLTVANTMGSFIDNYIKDHGLKPGDAIDISFQDLLIRYLERSREVVEGDPYGKKERRRLTDVELGPHATAMWNAIKKDIESSPVLKEIPLSPIDFIKNKLEEAGYTFGEITGREHTVDYSGGNQVYRRRSGSARSIGGRKSTIVEFNNGKLDVLLINQSGATGISLHSSEKFDDQRRRHMMIIQAEGNIDTHMQVLGRVNRTGQIIRDGKGPKGKPAIYGLPRYSQLVADVPAEKRPAAVLAKKMASLNANTTASRGSAVTSKDVVDFMNDYGDQVVATLMEDNQEWHDLLDTPLDENEQGDGLKVEGAIRKVTGRIPLLLLAQQEELYGMIEAEYQALIEEKDRLGENALEAKTLDLQAKVEKVVPVFQGKTVHDASGKQVGTAVVDDNNVVQGGGGISEGLQTGSPFSEGANAEIVDVKKLGQSYTSDEVLERLRVELDLSAEDDYGDIVPAGQQRAEDMIEKMNDEFTPYLQEALDTAKPESRNSLQTRLMGMHDRLELAMSEAPLGRMVTLKTRFGDVPATLIRIEKKGDPVNPAALGAWKFTFAVADAIRHITFPATRLFVESNAPSETTDVAAIVIKEYEAPEHLRRKPALAAFDESQSESREKRVIITGNLLAGFSKFVSGRITNYTTADGKIRMGILMPAKFDIDKALNEQPVEFEKAEDAIAFLQHLTRQGKPTRLTSVEDKLYTVAQIGHGDEFRISVAASREKGGKIFLDRKILDAAKQDFVKAAQVMRADLPRHRAVAALQAIIDAGHKLHAPQHRQEAKDFLEASNSSPAAIFERDTIFAVFRTLGDERATAEQALSDARAITGLVFPVQVDEVSGLRSDVAQRLNIGNGRIEMNRDMAQSRAFAAQSMSEELLHALDNIAGERMMSAASGRLEIRFDHGAVVGVGDIAAEALAAWESGHPSISPFLMYPFRHHDLSRSRMQVELFARLGVIYIARPDAMRRLMPKAYEAYRDFFDTIRGQSPARAVPGQVPSAQPADGGRSQGDYDRRGHGGIRPSVAGGIGNGQAGAERIVPQIDREGSRAAIARIFDAPARGGIVQSSPEARTGPRVRTAAENLARDITPVDKVLSAPFKAIRWEQNVDRAWQAVSALNEKATDASSTYEMVRAGVESNFGLEEAYVDRRVEMQVNLQRWARGALTMLDKLGRLTRDESRVAYEWMNERDADDLIAALPDTSKQTLREIKELVRSLGEEAVRLGQLSREVFERNELAYLHRSYLKHEIGQTLAQKIGNRKAIAVWAEQYRQRGIKDWRTLEQLKETGFDINPLTIKGQKFVRLELRAAVRESTGDLSALGGRERLGRLRKVVYVPAGEAIPAEYGTWRNDGEWEVRWLHGGKIGLWRDLTDEEQHALGVIDEVRFAVAKTLHLMTHDIEVGRMQEWVAREYGRPVLEAGAREVSAAESMSATFGRNTWVKVPDAKVKGTNTRKYGSLAGLYVPGPVWNDLRQHVSLENRPGTLRKLWDDMLRMWKVNKTALSPGVHMNNIMANFFIADFHDLRSKDLLKALRVMLDAKLSKAPDQANAELYRRFEDSGALHGSFKLHELQREALDPILDEIRREAMNDEPAAMTRVLSMVSWLNAASTAKRLTVDAMVNAYQAEDEVFRLAMFLKATRNGVSDLEAGKLARKAFLDYDINAPWIQALRRSGFPFIAFPYRAIPKMVYTFTYKPWKIIKIMGVATLLNSFAYTMLGLGDGDEDRERKLLSEEKSGKIWGLFPKLLRMPWQKKSTKRDGTSTDDPVFLDVRRWFPGGDVFDVGGTHAAIPWSPTVLPGGPLALLSELLGNRSQFTGQDLTLPTDTAGEMSKKVGLHLYRFWMPNHFMIPGTWSFEGLRGAGAFNWTGVDAISSPTGEAASDVFGREMSLPQSFSSALGVKLGTYPEDVAKYNLVRRTNAQINEITANVYKASGDVMRKKMSTEDFRTYVLEQSKKIKELQNKTRDRLSPSQQP